ncbi:hypothetical protein HK096_003960 [Nowakowskiella sp. JEL0078]|nr:hypothetical protein HK096_003960 [Nowakowskiella sp. JEL0078]
MLGPLMRLGKLQQTTITDCLEVSELKYLQARQDVTSFRTQLVLNAILFSSTTEYHELTSPKFRRHQTHQQFQHQDVNQWQDQQWTTSIQGNTYQDSNLTPADTSVIERSEIMQHSSDDPYDSSHTSLLFANNINGTRKKRNKLRTLSYHNKSILSSGSGEGQTFTSEVRERLRSITLSTVGSASLSRRSSRGSKYDFLDFYVTILREGRTEEVMNTQTFPPLLLQNVQLRAAEVIQLQKLLLEFPHFTRLAKTIHQLSRKRVRILVAIEEIKRKIAALSKYCCLFFRLLPAYLCIVCSVPKRSALFKIKISTRSVKTEEDLNAIHNQLFTKQGELMRVEEELKEKERMNIARNDVESKLLSILDDIIGVYRLQDDTEIADYISNSERALTEFENILDNLSQIMVSLENVVFNVKGARSILKELAESLEIDVTLSAVVSSSVNQHENSSAMSQFHSYLSKANGSFEFTIGLINICFAFAQDEFLDIKTRLESIGHERWKKDADRIYVRGGWERSSLSLQALRNDIIFIDHIRKELIPLLASHFDRLKMKQEAKYRTAVEDMLVHRLAIMETALGVWNSFEKALEEQPDKPGSQSPTPSFETDESSLPRYPDTDMSSVLSSSPFSNEGIDSNSDDERDDILKSYEQDDDDEHSKSMDDVFQNSFRMSLTDEMPKSRRLFNRDLKSPEPSIQMPDLAKSTTVRLTRLEHVRDVKPPELDSYLGDNDIDTDLSKSPTVKVTKLVTSRSSYLQPTKTYEPSLPDFLKNTDSNELSRSNTSIFRPALIQTSSSQSALPQNSSNSSSSPVSPSSPDELPLPDFLKNAMSDDPTRSNTTLPRFPPRDESFISSSQQQRTSFIQSKTEKAKIRSQKPPLPFKSMSETNPELPDVTTLQRNGNLISTLSRPISFRPPPNMPLPILPPSIPLPSLPQFD